MLATLLLAAGATTAEAAAAVGLPAPPAAEAAEPAARTTAVPADSVYQAVDPRRVMSSVPLGPRSTTTLTLTDVPPGATAVALNVTAAAVSATTFVSACAGGTPLATCRTTSAFNPAPGEDTPAAVIVALGGPDGDQVQLYNNAGSLRLFADLQGFYVAGTPAGSLFLPRSPERVLSFRSLGARDTHTLTLPSVPAGATAVAVNLTAAGATASSFVSACPAGQPPAVCTASSNLNPFPGRDVANLAVVKLGGASGDQITLYNNAGTVRMIADVQGYFVDAATAAAGAGRLRPVAPVRALTSRPMGRRAGHTLTLADVPAGATSVAMTVTASGTTATTYVSSCPAGTDVGTCTRSSTLNPRSGIDTANTVLLQLGGPDRDQVTLYNDAGTTNLIADVQGYFVADAGGQVPASSPASGSRSVAGPETTGVPAGKRLTVHDGDLTI
ncbi:hypothetical protein, partial [uncultured Cellulomonas sp.]|uniref:hypothetical protein n=1 Tax=uncultured Cellulomonas sp. TaxID=189682 RepID=UPI0026265B18